MYTADEIKDHIAWPFVQRAGDVVGDNVMYVMATLTQVLEATTPVLEAIRDDLQ